MENKAKIGFLILLIFYIILAESEMWGPVIITGDTPAEAILKLSNTPAAVSAESVLVKRYDSTVSSYPINNIKTTKIQWDSVTSKPTAYNPVLHQHDSIYYRETEVNNLLSSKSDTSHTHPQSKINGLVDTITNHRNAIASKFATADTNKLARKSHIHNISDVNNLSTELSNRYTKTELQTSGSSQVHWGNITNKPSTFAPSAHNHNRLIGIVDTRDVATTPNDYPKSVIPQFKLNTAIGLSAGGMYSTTLGIFGWNDPSGGHAHELAFSSSGIYNRIGPPGSSWGNWKRLLTTEDISTTVAPSAHSHAWNDITGKPSTFAPAAHGLVSSTHTVSGLTAGHVLKALSATTYGFAAIAWSDIASKPSTFTPAAHTHAIADVTSLQTALDGKLNNLGVAIQNFNDIGPDTPRSITVFSSGYNSSDQPSGASWWSGFEFRHRIPEDYRSQIAMGTTGTPQLAIRNKTNGVWGSWYKVWHEGNFDPADYQSAITGTANKVLSIQAGGSGVKTGSISDNGTTALIGKTTATPGFGYKLEVEGDAFINGDLLLNAITAYGPLNLRNNIHLLNKAGDGWLSFVTRDVSGSEAVVDLLNVGSISMISPSTNNTMELYVDSSRSAAGINAQTGLLEIRNTSTATNGDILIQSVASDINISSQGESGEISLDAKRVKISRRNLKSQTFTYTVSGSYIIDLNNYYDVNLFIINSTADWVSIGFKNATVGDEIHVNIKGYGAIAYQRDPNSENAWYEWPNDPIELDEFFYKLICTGTDNYHGQTINTWIIGS